MISTKSIFSLIVYLLLLLIVPSNVADEKLDGSLHLIMELRNKARLNKDFETSDLIRDSLSKLNIQINDTSEGTSFKIN
mgnify:CR=1 FL=1